MPELGQDDRYWAIRALDFVDAAEAAKTPEQVVNLFSKSIADVGYHAYVILTLPDNKTEFSQRVISNGWKDEWTDIYAKEKLQDFDPVARHSVRTVDPYYWTEAPYDPEQEPLAHSIMQRAFDFAMTQGFCVPIHYESGLGAAVSIAGEKPDMSKGVRSALHLMALYAHNRVRVLLKPPLPSRPNLLSEREREVLRWAAAGKTNGDIGIILGIAERTVRFHMTMIANKLDTVNRMTSVTRGIAMGEIPPPY